MRFRLCLAILAFFPLWLQAAEKYSNLAPLVPSSAQIGATYAAVLDLCTRMERGEGPLIPVVSLQQFLDRSGATTPPIMTGVDVQIISVPKYGKLEHVSEGALGSGYYIYRSNDPNRLGQDKFGFELGWQAKKYKIFQQIEMVEHADLAELSDLDPNQKYYKGSCDSVPRVRDQLKGRTK